MNEKALKENYYCIVGFVSCEVKFYFPRKTCNLAHKMSISNSNKIQLKSKRMHFLFNGHIKRLKLLTTAKKPRFQKLSLKGALQLIVISKKIHYLSVTNLVKENSVSQFLVNILHPRTLNASLLEGLF